METEILTSLANKGAIGVVILSVVAVIYIVRLFLKHMETQAELSRQAQANEAKLSRESQAEESRLSRDAHKETAKMGAQALDKVTQVVSDFHKSNQDSHTKILGDINEVKNKIK